MSIDNYLYMNRIFLKFVGLYPVSVIRYVLCSCSMLLIVVPQIVQISHNWQDLNIVLETSSVLITILLALLKSSVWIFKKESIEFLINFMMTDYWQLAETTGAFKKLEVYATFAKKITNGYLVLICNALLFFFSLPLFDILIAKIKNKSDSNAKSFPFVAFYPETFYHSPFFEITYLSQIIATSVCGLVILATDTLIATALFHTCGHFKILEANLQYLDLQILRINDVRNNPKTLYTYVRSIKVYTARIISHHQIVLGFCDIMEENFNPMLLLQTLTSSLIICLVGLQVSATLQERSKLIKYFCYLIMALFQLLLFCYPGDVLMSESSNISKAAHFVQWYELPTLLRIEICMLIFRGQKPSYITAGKFYVMHLENFSAVLSTAVSYFMLLRSFSIDTVDK